jgi:hypothetical protein
MWWNDVLCAVGDNFEALHSIRIYLVSCSLCFAYIFKKRRRKNRKKEKESRWKGGIGNTPKGNGISAEG